MPRNSRRLRMHCNNCGRDTHHKILKTHECTGEEPVSTADASLTITWKVTWCLLECCGCEEISIQKRAWFSETEEVTTDYYPPRVIRHSPRWANELPDGVAEVLAEVYIAINSNNRRLAAMGARCLIDLVVLDKVGDMGSFAEKMQAMEEEGLLSSQSREYLEAALDIGSAAAHRGHNPSPETLILVMDVVENFLQAAYILNEAGQEIAAETPPRPPRRRRASQPAAEGDGL